MRQIVLASTSVYRKMLLDKFNIPFQCAKPHVDESPLLEEPPHALVERLAIEKARAVAQQFENALIIGSDQVAVCDGKILGKPGNFDNALAQLTSFSGKSVTFLTGLCVLDNTTNQHFSIVEPFHVHFKTLNQAQITYYLNAEQPYQCAGSFKSEGLGICLFNKLEGDDPNSLIGLPLIKLHELFTKFDFDVLANQSTQK